jgi:hypothetical protein
MRIKYDYRTAGKDTYKRYKLEFPESSLTYEEFKEIVYTYSELFREYILETGDVAKLPFGFGYFTVVKKKVKRYKNFKDPEGNNYINLPVDWKSTREEGKKVYHFNFHTDGFKCRWFWHIKTARLPFYNTLVFKPSRETSRLLAKYLMKPNSVYIQMYRELVNKKF